jgi:acyl carrier protein
MDLAAKVQEIVIESLRAAYSEEVGIAMETDLGDIGFDSLGLTMIVARIESEYDVEFSSEHILEMYQSITVADLVGAVEAGLAGPNGAA